MSFSFMIELLFRHFDESPGEFLAFAWFLLCWLGYNSVLDRFLGANKGLSARVHLYRVRWMMACLSRENRVMDINILRNLQSSMSFFASTSILILAGLLAMLGATTQAMAIIKQIPFTQIPTKFLWYLKIFLLIFLYIYVFFKMTWALRQLNYMSILIGSMPAKITTPNAQEMSQARRAARIHTMAVKEMNRGVRGYYFSMAVLGWFISPTLFVLSSALVIVILYRREFKSETTRLFIHNLDEENIP